MNRRVGFASLLAFFLHGSLILAGVFRLSYDGYVHMFFADHYLRDWWSLWDPRWYTGFEVTSYPPLVHQLIAILGRLIGVEAAFGLILWVVVSAYPVAVYNFSLSFVPRRAAEYAAFGSALLPSIYLSAHNFGQLPSLASTLLALFGAAALADYLRQGGWLNGLLAVSLFTTATAGHHATLLFQLVLAATVLLQHLLKTRSDWPAGLSRFAGFCLLSAAGALGVVWPFWMWGSQQAMQTPIDHLSRHNFLQDPFAAIIFFLPMYGLLIPLIPLALRIGLRKRYWGLNLAFLGLFLLGLGGTTPLPRILFRADWAWLTYDRFAFWASLLLLPFFGLIVALAQFKRKCKTGWPVSFAQSLFFVLMVFVALVAGSSPLWLPTQPHPIDMGPLVEFLNEGDHSQYRYLTLGFGDQLARLSRLTQATTIDGSYHTARGLPVLRDSGIGQIDTAFWLPNGMKAVQPIIASAGGYGVRWAFVALHRYDPILRRHGWAYLFRLPNGVEVWENFSARLPRSIPPPAFPPFQSFSWGFLPLLSLGITVSLALRRHAPAASHAVFTGVRSFAIGLLPIGLTFWYYRPVFVFEHSRIYFAYSDALFFLSDGLALVILLTWLVERLADIKGQMVKMSINSRRLLTRPDAWLFTLCLLGSLSIFWSHDWRISLYLSLHLWLCFGLYSALRRSPQAWRWFSLGCIAALGLQAIIGGGQFIFQSTAFTAPLGLNWPGDLSPDQSGASIIQLAEGTRWLRAYGTLPHPNLLGGFTLALLAGPVALFLVRFRQRFWLLLPFLAGLTILALSFSRSAWLGLLVLVGVLILHRQYLGMKPLVQLGTTGFTTLSLLVVYLYPLFSIRLGQGQVQAEQVSSFTRIWLIERTLELIHKHPWIGTGLGSFSLALSMHVASFYQIEPVHNIPLLVMEELGPAGLLLVTGLAGTVILNRQKKNHRPAIVFQAAILGLLVIGLFDHYLWTLAPGRVMFVTLLGLWAGQVWEQ